MSDEKTTMTFRVEKSLRAAYDRARKDAYYSAFGENFRYVDILAKLGLCYRQLDRLDRARELGAEILAIDPEHKIGKALRAP